MTSQPTPYDNVAAAIEQLALYVVALERAIASPSRPDSGVTDTPGLGVLMALELFGPMRPKTLAELLNMHSGTTSKRIEAGEVSFPRTVAASWSRFETPVGSSSQGSSG